MARWVVKQLVVAAVALLIACRNDPAPVAAPEEAGLAFIHQTEASDCGPAAIAMTLNYYGHHMTLEATKAAMHFHSEETNALELVRVAEANGLGAAGVSAGPDDILPSLRPGDILHIDFNHFVVFEGISSDGVRLLDPGKGRVALDRASFAKRFTGVALLFERSPEALSARKRAIGVAPAR